MMECIDSTFGSAEGQTAVPTGPWTGHHFESCHFDGVAFGQMDWRNARFEQCTFSRCDLTEIRWTGAKLHGVKFDNCNLNGLRWNTLTTLFLKLELTQCQATFGDWSDMELNGARMLETDFTGADFSGTDARKVDWSGSRLRDSIFQRTDLRESDLRTATNWSIDPVENKVRGARFSPSDLEGLIGRLGICLD